MTTPLFVDFNQRYHPLKFDDLYLMAWRRGQRIPLGAIITVTDHDEIGEQQAEVVIKDYEHQHCVIRLIQEGVQE